MATEKSIKYKLSMKDGTSSTLKKVQKSISSTRKGFGNLTDSLAKLTIIGTGVSRTLTNIGRTASRALEDTVGQFMQFEKGMAEVATITDLSREEMSYLGDEIQRFSREYAVDANDAAKALYQTISAGGDATNGAAEAMDIMSTALKFGKAGLVGAEDSVRLLMTVINSYGMEAADATKVSDTLFSLIKNGVTTGSELAGSFGRVTKVAATAGVGFGDLSAAMAMLTKNGLSTEEATTALRALLLSIVNPTKQASEAARELGLSYFNEATLKSEGGLFKVLSQVNEKAGDSVGTLAKVLPNVRALVGALAAAGDEDDIVTLLDDMKNSAGATDTALGKMTDTFAFKWEKLIAQIDSLKTRFGEIVASSTVLSGFMKVVSDSVTDVIDSLEKGSTASTKFGEVIDNFLATTIPSMVEGAATLLLVFGKVAGFMADIATESPPIGTSEVPWPFSMAMDWDEASGKFVEMGTAAATLGDQITDMAVGTAESINTVAAEMRASAEASIAKRDADRILTATLDGLKTKAEEILSPFSFIGDMFSRAKKTSDELSGSVEKASGVMSNGAKSTKDATKEWSSFEDNVNAAATTITKAGGMIPAISETAEAVKTVVHETDNVKWLFIAIVEKAVKLRNVFGELGGTFSNSMTPALNAVSTWLDDLFDRLGEWGTELGTTLQDAVAGWYTTKHELEVLDAARSQDIHAASASSAAAITNAAIASIMPSLSAAATAALIATQGGAQVHAGLLPALLAAAAAQGAAFAAFADGGRVTSPTLALIGEAGDETIIPETRTGRARDVLSDLASRRPELFAGVSQGAGAGVTSNNINISVSGGGSDEGIAERIADEVDRILGRRIS